MNSRKSIVPTMKDVARHAGVSLATVSSALSGAAYVSPDLKQRVMDAVQALGYEPNTVASGLKKGTTTLLGLIVPDITNPFFTEFVHSVQKRARHLGYSVLLCDSERNLEQEASLVKLMRAHRAAGTILCPTGGEESYSDLMRDISSMHVVTADHSVVGDRLDSVVLDNAAAARMATEHILQFGHEKVATIAGPKSMVPGRERLRGFVEAMRAAGIEPKAKWIKQGAFREEEAFLACRDLLSKKNPPTALFVANNHMAIGAMRAIAAAGLSCPQDISLVALDDFPWAAAFRPALTVVRQPVDAMAEAAMTALMKRIGGSKAEPRHQVFTPELVVRESCAAPRS
jgi:LacI family transcriptional regulator